jgi:hypothetical protein
MSSAVSVIPAKRSEAQKEWKLLIRHGRPPSRPSSAGANTSADPDFATAWMAGSSPAMTNWD